MASQKSGGQYISNSERFLATFNKIEHYLRKVTGESKETAFYTLIEKGSQARPEVRHFSDDLKEFAELRNAIVHDRGGGYVIAEPHDKAVNSIEHIASVLLNPPRVIDMFRTEVCTLKLSDSIANAVKIMLAESFSQIPINNTKEFVALLTTNTVTRWLGKCVEEDIFSLKEALIEIVLKHSEETHWEDNCCFLGRNQTIFEALDKFHDYENKGKRLEAILITEIGRPSESLLGLIDVWDLPKIYAKI